MSKIEDKCKHKGVRLTDQRRIIAKVMSDSKQTYGSKDHPDVDELHKRVNELDKNISIATVYRTVKLFEEDKWRNSKINFISKNEIEILLDGKFVTERGRINCSLRENTGEWRWLGIQFVISNL